MPKADKHIETLTFIAFKLITPLCFSSGDEKGIMFGKSHLPKMLMVKWLIYYQTGYNNDKTISINSLEYMRIF